jgi:hypothetical protein
VGVTSAWQEHRELAMGLAALFGDKAFIEMADRVMNANKEKQRVRRAGFTA